METLILEVSTSGEKLSKYGNANLKIFYFFVFDFSNKTNGKREESDRMKWKVEKNT